MHDARAAVGLRAPQERPDPRRELRHRERLHHVVVGAEVEAAHPVFDRVARRQHQDRNRLFRRPQAAQHLVAVHARQADVQDHQVEVLLGGGQHGVLAALGDVDGMAFGLEDAGQARSERGVVLDDEQSHRGSKSGIRRASR